jgi:hypothetical protein
MNTENIHMSNGNTARFSERTAAYSQRKRLTLISNIFIDWGAFYSIPDLIAH